MDTEDGAPKSAAVDWMESDIELARRLQREEQEAARRASEESEYGSRPFGHYDDGRGRGRGRGGGRGRGRGRGGDEPQVEPDFSGFTYQASSSTAAVPTSFTAVAAPTKSSYGEQPSPLPTSFLMGTSPRRASPLNVMSERESRLGRSEWEGKRAFQNPKLTDADRQDKAKFAQQIILSTMTTPVQTTYFTRGRGGARYLSRRRGV